MKYIKEYNEYLNQNFWNWFGNSKMVDKNGKPKVCYHGTNYNFSEFKKSTIGSANDGGYYGKGFYFTHDEQHGKGEAKYYGGHIMEVYLKIENPFKFDELIKWKGEKNHLMFYQPFLFLYNVAKTFPEIANTINVHKTKWNEDRTEGDLIDVPISEFAKLVDKYKDDIETFEFTDNRGDEMISGYVKSKAKIVKYDYTKEGGQKGEYLDKTTLGRYSKQTPKEEVEFGLIVDAIKEHEGIDYDYLVEGTMTRNPQITEAIAKKHDGILAGDEVVVFEPEQIKSASNNNGKFDSNNPNINESVTTNLYEYRQQLEIPFNGKHPLHDKPLHVHILDALSVMDKENGVKEKEYYSSWTTRDIENMWSESQSTAFDDFKSQVDMSDVGYVFLNKYDPIDNPEYFDGEVQAYIEDNELYTYNNTNVSEVIEEFELYYSLTDHLSDKGERVLKDEVFYDMFDAYQDEYECKYTLTSEMNEDGLIPLYRAINYGSGDKDDAYENIISHNCVGIYWSFEHEGAIPHGGGRGETMILTALVKPEYINWEATVFKSAWDLRDEKEVEIIEDKDIMIVDIEYGDGKGNLKLPKPFIVKT